MKKIIGIKDEWTGKQNLAAVDTEYAIGDYVVAQYEKGTYLACVTALYQLKDNELPQSLAKIERLAHDKDFQAHRENQDLADASMSVVRELIKQNGLQMTPVNISFPLDRDHVLITFTAAGRVDFRQLLRDLASHFRARIELRQINSREEAKVYGGLGPCGRALCCSSYLGEFPTISIKMAKRQGLSLNSGKTNGLCGRLMCCLEYEDDFYKEAMRLFPDVGTMVQVREGQAEVVGIDVFSNSIKVKVDGRLAPVAYRLEEVVSNG